MPLALAALLLLPALLHAAAALRAGPGTAGLSRATATLATAAALGAAALAGALPAAGDWLAAGPLRAVMLLLANVVGLVVIRYAVTALDGDAAQRRCLVWLHLCLAAVNVLAVTNHLLVLWLAWTAISTCLHQLLVCYPERFRAVLAAHKKFLFARIAETAVLTAVLLLWHEHGTFRIDHILAASTADGALSAGEQAAAVLFALAALIKCAQLPVHGWLIQVVEAPTPVSALLHAGVINLGGFLMLLMAPLVMLSTPARWLLLVVAGATAVLAALVMMTRISIKVRLAWSTSAQMGLMLVECALGLHALALLHLVAHACYKAGAFLDSGNAVNAWIAARLAGDRDTATALHTGAAALALAAALLAALLLPHLFTPADAAALALVAVAALSGTQRLAGPLARLALVTGLFAAYGAHKALFGTLLPSQPDTHWLPALWVALLALALAAGQALLARQPAGGDGPWRRWLYAGFYLDEAVTRATLRIWPVALPASPRPAPAGDIARERGA